jgi:hypothetical protein
MCYIHHNHHHHHRLGYLSSSSSSRISSSSTTTMNDDYDFLSDLGVIAAVYASNLFLHQQLLLVNTRTLQVKRETNSSIRKTDSRKFSHDSDLNCINRNYFGPIP